MAYTVLLTGGAGYIGSHTALELLNAGFDVAVLDNLCNSKLESLRRVQQLTGRQLRFFQTDIRDQDALSAVFHHVAIQAVIHFAGLKSVGESVQKPVLYYENNVSGTLKLLQAMSDANVHNIVFSSSATVYGLPPSLPIREDFPLAATNPYGNTKLVIEDILRDLHHADPRWNIAVLRYFNPVGAHESGRIGEDPQGIPNNLMPYISQVATGKLPALRVFGNDYSTSDGTGVRDYVHVVDLALGHLKALQRLQEEAGQLMTLNLGTGHGYSVLEMLTAFEKACGKTLPFEIADRRPGDVAACYADPAMARQQLGWIAERDRDVMCRDTWRWQSLNPQGYVS